ncbi:MAG: peptidylprolyl isomerase [Kiritimatiellia bacterium]
MAKMHLMGAALVAATVVAGCCDKENCKGEAKDANVRNEATAEPAKDPNEIVVQIGDVKLTRGQLDADVQQFVALYGDKIPANQLDMAKQRMMMDIAQNFLQETALANKARELGYTLSDEDMKAREAKLAENAKNNPGTPATFAELAANHPLGAERAMAQIKDSLLIEKMLTGEIFDKDTKDYTEDANKIIERLKQQNEKCLSDADALAKIKALKAELDQTPEAEVAAKFAELAKANSACPSGQKGGDLDEFTHGQMVKEFDEVAFAQEVGKISDPVKTQFGYHLILTTKKVPAAEAKGDTPATPEKVRASHILIKVSEPEKIPEVAELVERVKKNTNRQKIQEFVLKTLQEAKITTAAEFAMLLPPPAEKPAEKAETAVEKPAEK